LTYQGVYREDAPGIGGLDGANSIVVSPDGAHVYVASRISDSLARFTRNQTTGALTFYTAAYDGYGGVDGLDGARAVAISADGLHVYVASQIDDAVAVFSRNTSTGALAFVECHKDSETGIDGLNTADGLAVSPDSRHIYIAGYDDDSVTLFRHQIDVFLPLAFR
jgi:fibronectin-binding autotransporter adhesin